jgi:predicted permease
VPHGYVVFNWIISALIYAIVSLVLVVVGGRRSGLLAALAILSIIFPIIGGVKATEGEVWSTRCRSGFSSKPNTQRVFGAWPECNRPTASRTRYEPSNHVRTQAADGASPT